MDILMYVQWAVLMFKTLPFESELFSFKPKHGLRVYGERDRSLDYEVGDKTVAAEIWQNIPFCFVIDGM